MWKCATVFKINIGKLAVFYTNHNNHIFRAETWRPVFKYLFKNNVAKIWNSNMLFVHHWSPRVKIREQSIWGILMLWIVWKYIMKTFWLLTLLDIFTLCLKLTPSLKLIPSKRWGEVQIWNEDIHCVHYLVIKELKVQYFCFKVIKIELNMKMPRVKKTIWSVG